MKLDYLSWSENPVRRIEIKLKPILKLKQIKFVLRRPEQFIQTTDKSVQFTCTIKHFTLGWYAWNQRRIQDFPAFPKGCGVKLLFWPIFPKNCMKIKNSLDRASPRIRQSWKESWGFPAHKMDISCTYSQEEIIEGFFSHVICKEPAGKNILLWIVPLFLSSKSVSL